MPLVSINGPCAVSEWSRRLEYKHILSQFIVRHTLLLLYPLRVIDNIIAGVTTTITITITIILCCVVTKDVAIQQWIKNESTCSPNRIQYVWLYVPIPGSTSAAANRLWLVWKHPYYTQTCRKPVWWSYSYIPTATNRLSVWSGFDSRNFATSTSYSRRRRSFRHCKRDRCDFSATAAGGNGNGLVRYWR